MSVLTSIGVAALLSVGMGKTPHYGARKLNPLKSSMSCLYAKVSNVLGSDKL